MARPSGRCIAAICSSRSPPRRRSRLDVTLQLGTRVEDFAAHGKGVTRARPAGTQALDERGIALIGADGIWSSFAGAFARATPPTFRARTAWRALIPADACRRNSAHPRSISGSAATPISCTIRSRPAASSTSSPSCTMNGTNRAGRRAGDAAESAAPFARWTWHDMRARSIAAPERWLKWALYDRRAVPRRRGPGDTDWGCGPSDAALPRAGRRHGDRGRGRARRCSEYLDDPADALRAYEGARWHRTMRAQQAARRQARIYGLSGPRPSSAIWRCGRWAEKNCARAMIGSIVGVRPNVT